MSNNVCKIPATSFLQVGKLLQEQDRTKMLSNSFNNNNNNYINYNDNNMITKQCGISILMMLLELSNESIDYYSDSDNDSYSDSEIYNIDKFNTNNEINDKYVNKKKDKYINSLKVIDNYIKN